MNSRTIGTTAILITTLALGACTATPEPTEQDLVAAGAAMRTAPPGTVDGSYDELELLRGRRPFVHGSVDGSYDPIELMRHRNAAGGD